MVHEKGTSGHHEQKISCVSAWLFIDKSSRMPLEDTQKRGLQSGYRV